jgi:transcriptional regulator with XRE-family HTH domain
MSLFDFEDKTPEDRAAAAESLHAANIARAIFHLRLSEGWSQGHLAALAQTTQARVSEIESLKGDPKLSTLGRVAYALGHMIDVVPIPSVTSTAMSGYTTNVRSTDYTMTSGGVGSNALFRQWAKSSDVSLSMTERTYG